MALRLNSVILCRFLCGLVRFLSLTRTEFAQLDGVEVFQITVPLPKNQREQTSIFVNSFSNTQKAVFLQLKLFILLCVIESTLVCDVK